MLGSILLCCPTHKGKIVAAATLTGPGTSGHAQGELSDYTQKVIAVGDSYNIIKYQDGSHVEKLGTPSWHLGVLRASMLPSEPYTLTQTL